MVALTLLDGTTIQLPTKPRRGHGERSGASDEAAAPASSGPRSLTSMTTVELVQALTAVANGADAAQVFGGKVPLEAICAALLRLLLRKGLIADWEVVEELRRKG
jgi:hypothetical protein